MLIERFNEAIISSENNDEIKQLKTKKKHYL
jgi:hypothetical protein